VQLCSARVCHCFPCTVPYRRTQADTDTGTNLQARESDKPEVGDNIFTSLMMAPVCTEVTRRSQHFQVETLSFSHPARCLNTKNIHPTIACDLPVHGSGSVSASLSGLDRFEFNLKVE
jgi:hypothetical protein